MQTIPRADRQPLIHFECRKINRLNRLPAGGSLPIPARYRTDYTHSCSSSRGAMTGVGSAFFSAAPLAMVRRRTKSVALTAGALSSGPVIRGVALAGGAKPDQFRNRHALGALSRAEVAATTSWSMGSRSWSVNEPMISRQSPRGNAAHARESGCLARGSAFGRLQCKE